MPKTACPASAWTQTSASTHAGRKPTASRCSPGLKPLVPRNHRFGDTLARRSNTETAMRLLHTMLRVGNLQRSIAFYTEVLGMRLLRTTERPEQKYDLAFVGYGNNPDHAELELTYNYGVDSYELGTAFGHVAIGVPNVKSACDKVRTNGGKVTREPGAVKGGTSVIAFLEDPDGYKIEFIQTS